MPSQAWVADKALPLLRKNPNMGAKAMQIYLQDEYNVTLGYDTVCNALFSGQINLFLCHVI
jgi:hypothetical protein